MAVGHCNQFHVQVEISGKTRVELFGKTPLFFRYSGVNAANAANAVNLQAKCR